MAKALTLPLAIEFGKEIDQALKQFGVYSYNDKGPYEVMDVASCVRRLRKLPVPDVLAVLKDLSNHEYGGTLVTSLLSSMDDWEDLFALDDAFIEEYH